MRKILSIVAVFCAVTLVAAGGALAGSLGAFKLKTADGKDFNNETIKGKKVLFVVMQTACTQCRSEMSDISENYDELSKMADIYTLMVDMQPERGVEFYKSMGFKPPLVLDPNFTIPTMAEVGVTPATIVVNEKGEITWMKTGYRTGQIGMIKEKL